MSGKQKIYRPTARLPKGMRDIEADELRALKGMIDTISAVYERYGFDPLDTPAFEYTDALGKFLPDTDRPNEGVFSFQDEDEQWLSLRYDLTAPLARYVAQNFDALPKPFRRYQTGFVYRNEKPGPGRFRQFMQFDADTVGAASPAADAEMCMLAADTLEALGIPRGSYVIKVSNRKILDGVMEAIGLGGPENAARRLIVLRAIDKYDRLGDDGVEQLLASGRKDESGDFTPGAGLHKDQIEKIMHFLTMRGEADHALWDAGDLEQDLKNRLDTAGGYETEMWQLVSAWASELLIDSPDGLRAIADVSEIWNTIAAAGYDDGRISFDPTVVRGLEYYTGPVFEAELTFPAEDESGQPVRFGSVGGGGRYDGLVARFRSQPVPATGFSLGVSRLYAALNHLGKLKSQAAQGPVVVTVFDKDRIAEYQRMVKALRDAPLNPDAPDGPRIRAELYLGNPKNFGNQLKYADKRNSPCVVIQGEDERQRGEVTIKDLVEGARLSQEITDNTSWREGRPAQFSVKTDELVEAVRSVLARQSN